MSRPPVDSCNPQNNPQNLVQQPAEWPVEKQVLSTPVRATALVASTTPVTKMPSQGETPLPQSRNSLNNPAIAGPLFGFSMPSPDKDYPYGVPTSMMENLQPNAPTFIDNVMATTPLYNPCNASTSTINNTVRSGGVNYIPQNTPSLNTTSMMGMRQQMDEINLELVNILTQKMGTIFNPLIAEIMVCRYQMS